MNCLFVFLSVALVAAVTCQSSTTTKVHNTHVHHSHAPKPTVEASEHEVYNFRYDGHIHEMVIKHGQSCYLMALTDAQKAKVHDPAGIKSIEAAALGLIADKSMQSTVDKSSLDKFTTHDCAKVTHIIRLKN